MDDILCLMCDGDEFRLELAREHVEGVGIMEFATYECNKCGWQTLDSSYMNILLKLYREALREQVQKEKPVSHDLRDTSGGTEALEETVQ